MKEYGPIDFIFNFSFLKFDLVDNYCELFIYLLCKVGLDLVIII